MHEPKTPIARNEMVFFYRKQGMTWIGPGRVETVADGILQVRVGSKLYPVERRYVKRVDEYAHPDVARLPPEVTNRADEIHFIEVVDQSLHDDDTGEFFTTIIPASEVTANIEEWRP